MKNNKRILIIGPHPPLRGGISEFNYISYKNLKDLCNVFVVSLKKNYPNFLFPGKSQFIKSRTDDKNFQNKISNFIKKQSKGMIIFSDFRHGIFNKESIPLYIKSLYLASERSLPMKGQIAITIYGSIAHFLMIWLVNIF